MDNNEIKNVILRHFEYKDVKSIRDNLYPDLSENDVRGLITEWNSCIYQGRYFEMFAVESGNRIVGYVSLYEKSRSVASAGVEIFPEERGKGFAYVAMIDLLRYVAEKGYQVILDQVRKDNQASIRLHEKLDFENDGYVYRNPKNIEVLLYLKLL